MVLEKEKWKDAWNFLPAYTKGKLTLKLIIEATACILVLL